MLLGTGHDYTLDWWALGILLYELIVGIPPFFHQDRDRMNTFILDRSVQFPDPAKHGITVSAECKDFITRLLHKDKARRLGVAGAQEVLQHPFFDGIDLQQLRLK